jgi:hypothetical protein
MKFYESHYEEYLDVMTKQNIHTDLIPFILNLPEKSMDMGNLIVYGPSGVGKYSQVLQMLKKYSPTNFKYDKKITIQTEKQTYIYHISDIHYEIDMSLLGCNSKILWNDIFLQIVDIISIKNEKVGFIVCKNFHMIHGELLDIFYSYIQQYSGSHHGLKKTNHEQENISKSTALSPEKFGGNIMIHFIIITENLSFLPNNILQSCHIVNVGRPSNQVYKQICISRNTTKSKSDEATVGSCENLVGFTAPLVTDDDVLGTSNNEDRSPMLFEELIHVNEIINIKELYSLTQLKSNTEIPKDIFNIVCDNIIKEIMNHKKLSFSNFRDVIYDILIYNLEMVECLWYILYYLINNFTKTGNIHKNNGSLSNEDITDILNKTYYFLKYYNNNYRPIYHLESIFFYIIVKLYNYELPKSQTILGSDRLY